MIPLGERMLRPALDEFVAHYHYERNHLAPGNGQGFQARWVNPRPLNIPCQAIHRRVGRRQRNRTPCRASSCCTAAIGTSATRVPVFSDTAAATPAPWPL